MTRYEIVVILEGVIEQTGNTIQVGPAFGAKKNIHLRENIAQGYP